MVDSSSRARGRVARHLHFPCQHHILSDNFGLRKSPPRTPLHGGSTKEGSRGLQTIRGTVDSLDILDLRVPSENPVTTLILGSSVKQNSRLGRPDRVLPSDPLTHRVSVWCPGTRTLLIEFYDHRRIDEGIIKSLVLCL